MVMMQAKMLIGEKRKTVCHHLISVRSMPSPLSRERCSLEVVVVFLRSNDDISHLLLVPVLKIDGQ